LWARQIAREGGETKALHEAILQARANVIWANTSTTARRGHFAMGVGLEAGLAIDAMAKDLEALIDRADLASLSGDEDELADALAGLAERLLVIRPFIPDKRNELPATWRTPSLFEAHLAGGTAVANIRRVGRGKANWPPATSP
jgi:hypothetical protein